MHVASMSLNFRLIGPPTAEFAALERLKKSPYAYNVKRILAGNDNIHESLDEFEIWLDLTTGFHGNR